MNAAGSRPAETKDEKIRAFAILAGMVEFAKIFAGKLVTETMLVERVHQGEEGLRETGDVEKDILRK